MGPDGPPTAGSGQQPGGPVQSVDGFAVPVSTKSLLRGAFRLKKETAEQFFGPDTIAGLAAVNPDGQNPKPLALMVVACSTNDGTHRCEAVNLFLSQFPAAARPKQASQQHKGAEAKQYCELLGLGAWLKAQGAVAGTHWVQVWRAVPPDGQPLVLLQLCGAVPAGLPPHNAEQLSAATAAAAAVKGEPCGGAAQTAASATTAAASTQRTASPAQQPAAAGPASSASATAGSTQLDANLATGAAATASAHGAQAEAMPAPHLAAAASGYAAVAAAAAAVGAADPALQVADGPQPSTAGSAGDRAASSSPPGGEVCPRYTFGPRRTYPRHFTTLPCPAVHASRT